jgi:hypothetical protein
VNYVIKKPDQEEAAGTIQGLQGSSGNGARKRLSVHSSQICMLLHFLSMAF